jgi:hypothetical protein
VSTLGIIQSVIKTELREAIDNESVDAWVIKTAAFIDELQAENKLRHIELGATQHAFTDYRAKHAMKACMMCNSLERVHCYANTEKLEARVAELEAQLREKNLSIVKVANNIMDMDNCEQDSDEIDEHWTEIKEFALLSTGRCDS